MGYVVLHLDKSPGNEAAMTDHIERKVIHPNVDPTRTHFNKELIQFPEGVCNRTEAIRHRLQTAGLKRKIGKNQVQVIRIMLSGSPEDMKRIQEENQLDNWCSDNIAYLKKTFGDENIVAATLHMDETTPHIHASVVPIVQGERRKKKKNKPAQTPKRQYKKKDSNRARLCADDVMAREKLTVYQDTYAEAMEKYGLERGIKGSEARHISLTEHFRNQAIQSKNLQENIEEYTQKEQEAKQKYEQIKGQLKTEEFKNSAADVGSTIMEGIGSVIGISKVKRQQKQIDDLTNENEKLKQEITLLNQTFNHERQENKKIVTNLTEQLNNIYSWLPDTLPLIKMGEYCKSIGFTEEMAKNLVNMNPVYFSGRLYSHEFSQGFGTAKSEAHLERDTKHPGIFNLLINKVNSIQWFRQKHAELQKKLGMQPQPKQKPKIRIK